MCFLDPPCISKTEGSMGCCHLFGSAFRRSNLPQILTLMKYSLDLSDPSLNQYRRYREHGGMGLSWKRRELHRLWITDDNDQLRRLILNASTLEHLRGWR